MTDLTAEEQDCVRVALQALRVRAGGWRPLARVLGVMHKTASNVGCGEKSVSPKMAFQIARLAGVTMEDLWRGSTLRPVHAKSAGRLELPPRNLSWLKTAGDILTRSMADTDLTAFKLDESGKAAFEDMGIENGTLTWKEADLQTALGYAEGASFRKAIGRAQQACISVGISIEEHFIPTDGGYKLTRFACYLIAMNADSKKAQVGAAQVYFAAIAETFKSALEHADGIERVAIRDEMTGGMKSLQGTAKDHGVADYALFQNAGYRGMYNMNLSQLRQAKGLPQGEVLLDRMGKVELAGNLFRITQTEAAIKAKGLIGQGPLEHAAKSVGTEVRKMMIKNTGTTPESLKLAPPIKDVKKLLKTTSKKFKELDGKKT